MDIVGTVNIELWAVLLGATDALLNLELPYSYELKRMKLSDTPLYDEIVNKRKVCESIGSGNCTRCRCAVRA